MITNSPGWKVKFNHPATYEQFIALAKIFEHAVAEKFRQGFTVIVQGGEISEVINRSNGDLAILAKTTLASSVLSDLDEATWKNLALSRIVFQSASNPDFFALLAYDVEDAYEIECAIYPADQEFQDKLCFTAL